MFSHVFSAALTKRFVIQYFLYNIFFLINRTFFTISVHAFLQFPIFHIVSLPFPLPTWYKSGDRNTNHVFVARLNTGEPAQKMNSHLALSTQVCVMCFRHTETADLSAHFTKLGHAFTLDDSLLRHHPRVASDKEIMEDMHPLSFLLYLAQGQNKNFQV